MKTALGFFLALLAGLAAGLAFGWLVNPVPYANTSPDSLRGDYQVDTVLMAAEAFQADRNVTLAANRLALLGKDLPPAQRVQQAAGEARRIGYPAQDVQRLLDLAAALQSPAPALGKAAPPLSNLGLDQATGQ